MAKIALNAVRLPKFEPVNGIRWSPRKIMVKDLQQRSGLAWFCTCAVSCVVFNTGPYSVLWDNSILITANMQLETGFSSSHQLKSNVAYKSRLKLASRAVLSADAGLLVVNTWNSLHKCCLLVLNTLKTRLDKFGTIRMYLWFRAQLLEVVASSCTGTKDLSKE